MKYIYQLLLVSVLLFAATLRMDAQVVISSNMEAKTDSVTTGAVLDLRGGGNKGLLLPRVQLVALEDPAPLKRHTAGMVVFNTFTDEEKSGSLALPEGYYYNDGGMWQIIADTKIASWFLISNLDQAATSNTDSIYHRGPVMTGGSDLAPHTQFQVTSSDKGVLLPNLTAEQIDAITADLKANNDTQALISLDGLTVFNTTTGCFSYFNGNPKSFSWVSLCFDIAPAAMVVECDASCGPHGTFTEYANTTAANFYRLKIRVNEAGNYSIRITTGQGYSFEKSGYFDTPGLYTIDVPAQGTPRTHGDHDVTVFLNGEDLTPVLPDVLPFVHVEEADVAWSIVCEGATPGTLNGTYLRGMTPDGTHYIDIKIKTKKGGNVVLRTNTVNGMWFQSAPTDLPVAVGSDSTMVVRYYASGSPTLVGTYTYSPEYLSGAACPFNVEVTSNLGSFKEPARSCLAIYNELNFGSLDSATLVTKDTEYWIRESGESTAAAVKTLCDMSNGGYTLVWSFSERTAYTGARGSMYTPDNQMRMTTDHQLFENRPSGVVKSETGSINYNDFRLSRVTMRNLKTTGDYRVQISYLPKTMLRDLWAKDFHVYVKPPSGSDFLEDDWSGDRSFVGNRAFNFVMTGRIMGLDFVRPSGGTLSYGGSAYSDGLAQWYNGSYNATHMNFAHGFRAGSFLKTSTMYKHPDDGGTPYSYTFSTRGFNNMFGWFAETGMDHMFGKCGSGYGDDYNNNNSDDYYDNTGCSASSRTPHRFNLEGGVYQGRYLQWWVK